MRHMAHLLHSYIDAGYIDKSERLSFDEIFILEYSVVIVSHQAQLERQLSWRNSSGPTMYGHPSSVDSEKLPQYI
jgi:hypothetical protein